ncbi:MAG: abhydrolase domain-containing 18 [Candidatus Lokiarchaeota archaeon]|nr:abhydrolase domain-containing 18 [Candidatus Lokiarchaeota archaeon]
MLLNDDNLSKTLKIEIPRRNQKVLIANFYKTDVHQIKKPPLVILLHGFPGDKLEAGRFPPMAKKLNENSIDAVAIDFAGYGENEREPVLLSKQIENLEDVYKWAQNKGYSSIGTLGLSMGGITSLLADLPDRKVAVFWAPAFYMTKIVRKAGKSFAGFWFRVLKKPIRFSNKKHEKVTINQQFIDEIFQKPPEAIDVKLANFNTPALIIQGTTDLAVFPKWSKHAYSKMPQDEHHKIECVKRSGHGFRGDKLKQFIDHSMDMFKRYL